MIFFLESDKSFYEASVDLGEVLLRLGFVVLQVDGKGEALHNRELQCDEDQECFAVSIPRLSEGQLAIDMRLGLVLPWRLSVFTEEGTAFLGFLLPMMATAAVGDLDMPQESPAKSRRWAQLIVLLILLNSGECRENLQTMSNLVWAFFNPLLLKA